MNLKAFRAADSVGVLGSGIAAGAKETTVLVDTGEKGMKFSVSFWASNICRASASCGRTAAGVGGRLFSRSLEWFCVYMSHNIRIKTVVACTNLSTRYVKN